MCCHHQSDRHFPYHHARWDSGLLNPLKSMEAIAEANSPLRNHWAGLASDSTAHQGPITQEHGVLHHQFFFSCDTYLKHGFVL
eukprot:m.59435 g.59435  ORF g.59435 m.59435 type:complete len:83 (-) comp13229_c2_seq1:161-409(-)